MEFLGSLLAFALGIFLVVKGGDVFVEAASGLARGLGLPAFLIGATVVSLATTLPEMMVSVLAAAQGKVEMAVGNALGSVTANTGLILATGMVATAKMPLKRGLQIPCLLLLAAAGILWAACTGGRLAAWGSCLLAVICVGFIMENVRQARKERTEERSAQAGKWIWRCLLGGGGIIGGSQLLISGGEGIAIFFGVPERIIAVTLLAVGTGLPELVTTLTALRKGEAAMSVGNIIGANIIDITLILPLSALVSGQGLPISEQNLLVDFPGFAVILLIAAVPLLLWKKGSRVQGVLLWLLYLCYLLCIF